MRRLVSILLITALIFNISGYYAVFRITLNEHKRQYCEHIYYSGLGSENILILNGENRPAGVSDNWEDDDLIYSGKNFEIIKIIKQDDENILYCVMDSEKKLWRTQLKDNFVHLDKSGSPLQEKNNRLIIPFFKEYIPQACMVVLFPNDSRYYNLNYFFSVQTNDFNNIFVPPKVC